MPRESDTLLPMFKEKENEINSNYRKKINSKQLKILKWTQTF